MTDLIKEELNIKEVIFEQKLDKFMDFTLRPNFKEAGPILGSKIKAFGAALAKADAASVVETLERDGSIVLDIDGQEMAIDKELVDVKIVAKEGFTVAMENNVFVILDTTITDDLMKEGLAREFVSKVQQIRKQKDFEVTDRINIYYHSDETVKKALEEHGSYIMKETLALEMVEKADELAEYDLNGHKTGIDVERV